MAELSPKTGWSHPVFRKGPLKFVDMSNVENAYSIRVLILCRVYYFRKRNFKDCLHGLRTERFRPKFFVLIWSVFFKTSILGNEFLQPFCDQSLAAGWQCLNAVLSVRDSMSFLCSCKFDNFPEIGWTHPVMLNSPRFTVIFSYNFFVEVGDAYYIRMRIVFEFLRYLIRQIFCIEYCAVGQCCVSC